MNKWCVERFVNGFPPLPSYHESLSGVRKFIEFCFASYIIEKFEVYYSVNNCSDNICYCFDDCSDNGNIYTILSLEEFDKQFKSYMIFE